MRLLSMLCFYERQLFDVDNILCPHSAYHILLLRILNKVCEFARVVIGTINGNVQLFDNTNDYYQKRCY